MRQVLLTLVVAKDVADRVPQQMEFWALLDGKAVGAYCGFVVKHG